MDEEETNIRYEYVYDHIEDPKWDKWQFLDKYGKKMVQRPVYAEKQGKIEGIIFQGYKEKLKE